MFLKFLASPGNKTNAGVLALSGLTEKALSSPTLYIEYANFLAEVRKGTGKTYVYSTLECYLREVINSAKKSFCQLGVHPSDHDHSATRFFSCVTPKSTTEAGRWLHQLQLNLLRDNIKAVLAAGEKFDRSCKAVYPIQVRRAAAVYGLVETYAAARSGISLRGVV